jgi:hypothetical protein
LTVRKTFDTSGKSPANYHHRENHAEPGRRNPPRAFLLKFSNRTAAARHDASSPNARRLKPRQRAAVRTFEIIISQGFISRAAGELAGSRHLRASIPTIRINQCRHPAGCSRFCLPPSDNLEHRSSVGSSFIVRRGLLFRRSVIFRNLLTAQKTFDTSGKSPANYHHRENHAEPGRRNPPRAFLLKFRIGRRPHVTTPHLPTPVA